MICGFCLWIFSIQSARVLYWLSLQEADIERDEYKLKACFAIDVKIGLNRNEIRNGFISPQSNYLHNSMLLVLRVYDDYGATAEI